MSRPDQNATNPMPQISHDGSSQHQDPLGVAILLYTQNMIENATHNARIAVSAETKAFVVDLVLNAEQQRRRDGAAETILERHVKDAVNDVYTNRRGPNEPGPNEKRASEWAKWIGFAFVGSVIGWMLGLHDLQSVLSWGSLVPAIVLIAGGLMIRYSAKIDRPLTAALQARKVR